MNKTNTQEKIVVLLENDKVRIERIYSYGVISPPDFWYNEPLAEWVSVVSGNAQIRLTDKTITLNTKDCYFIKPHTLHQVYHTSYDCEWLCVYLKD